MSAPLRADYHASVVSLGYSTHVAQPLYRAGGNFHVQQGGNVTTTNTTTSSATVTMTPSTTTTALAGSTSATTNESARPVNATTLSLAPVPCADPVDPPSKFNGLAPVIVISLIVAFTIGVVAAVIIYRIRMSRRANDSAAMSAVDMNRAIVVKRRIARDDHAAFPLVSDASGVPSSAAAGADGCERSGADDDDGSGPTVATRRHDDDDDGEAHAEYLEGLEMASVPPPAPPPRHGSMPAAAAAAPAPPWSPPPLTSGSGGGGSTDGDDLLAGLLPTTTSASTAAAAAAPGATTVGHPPTDDGMLLDL